MSVFFIIFAPLNRKETVDMIVCIAEKPSVARDIAHVLGANSSRDGYMEGNGYQVTWTFGHLCTLKEPHDYTPSWKAWSLSSLPMIPPRFGIKLIEHDQGIEKQFKTIEKLMQNADEIVNCGDAGQEGELIQRWVMQKAGAKCPVKRLWISSLTEEAIREGFKNLKDQKEYQSMYEAGLSRAIGDWVLGMNATRLYTLKYGQNRQVLSIGRVQTPTLALIVNRQHEIEHFEPKQYWVLSTLYRDTTFTAVLKKSEEDLMVEIEKAKEKAEKALAEFLRPEFINRVDEIITFRSLDEKDFSHIAGIMLGDLSKALKEKDMNFTYTPAAAALIAQRSFSVKFGARNMRRFIQREVEDPLAEKLLADQMRTITQVRLSVSGGQLVTEIKAFRLVGKDGIYAAALLDLQVDWLYPDAEGSYLYELVLVFWTRV